MFERASCPLVLAPGTQSHEFEVLDHRREPPISWFPSMIAFAIFIVSQSPHLPSPISTDIYHIGPIAKYPDRSAGVVPLRSRDLGQKWSALSRVLG